MRLIEEIEITYFRSLYKTRIRNLGDMTIFFGLNDSGKSNILRALNLFFNGQTDPGRLLDFETDFSDIRRSEVRRTKRQQFISVKLTFRVPKNFPSLGRRIIIEKKWVRSGNTIEKAYNYNRRQINNRAQLATITKFKNQIFFHYLPAIKGLSVYQDILERMYGVAARSDKIGKATEEFLNAVNKELEQLADNLKALFGGKASISIPRDMEKFFRGLDFSYGEEGHSLLLQKGDGVKARHLPELLRYIDERDSSKRYFIWGFEEPENSLDLKNAREEAQRFSEFAVETNRQIFLTSHSPAFYLMEPVQQQGKETLITKFFVRKQVVKEAPEGEQRDRRVVPKDALTAINNLEKAEEAMNDAGIMAFPLIIQELEKEKKIEWNWKGN